VTRAAAVLPALPVPVLVAVAGPLEGERLDVAADVVLGRGEVDVVIDDSELSRRHAVLRRVDGRLEVEDLGSLNGTWVNGARIAEPTRLEPGDSVRLGKTNLEVALEPAGLPGALVEAPPPTVAPVARPTPAARRGRLSPETLARAASRRPWAVVGTWIGLVVASMAAIVLLLGSALTSDQELTNDPESSRAAALVDEQFQQGNSTSDLVIVRSPTLTVDDEAFRSKVEQLAAELEREEVVLEARTFLDGGDTLISADRRATLIPLVLQPDWEEEEGSVQPVLDLVEAAGDERFEVTITGEAAFDSDLQALAQHDLKTGEFFFGAPAALIILVLVFGAVVAGLVPLLMAVVSIVVTLAIVALVGQSIDISLFAVNMITGMGLALGIDYALFVLSRYREERRGGREPLDAIAASGATASRAVMFSGIAFVLALLGMLLVPDLILRSLAAGAIIVGFVSVIAALTLLPAVLSLLGDRINSLRVPIIGRNIAAQAGSEGRFWGAIVRAVIARPVVSLLLSTALLLAAAVPILDYETGFAGTSTLPDRVAAKQGFNALNESFPGATADPASVVVQSDASSPAVRTAIERLRALIGNDDDFGPVSVQQAQNGDLALLEVPVAGDSQAAEAIAAVKRLRDDYVPEAFADTDVEVLVGGQSAETIDYTETTGFWMPIIFAFVLALSFVLLTIAFRSIVVPLKAIVLNLLSVGAAYGLLVLVFVKGVGADFLGFQQVDTIVAWVPLFLFSVLFGLSMDYHVFLLSRIRERYIATGDNDYAVEHGVSSTARLITGAALIIIAVFSGFAMGDLVMFQQMGFGIAVALFLDATIIRSVLVPASMKLLGARNWYLPSALGWLPDIDTEGEEPAPRPAPL
jgi:RND superfamily putative drug exporter